MIELEEQVNQLINQILLKAENQYELLIGQCRSKVKLTNTQEHILMLLSEGQKTNSELAKALNVSQAAVTKAVKVIPVFGRKRHGQYLKPIIIFKSSCGWTFYFSLQNLCVFDIINWLSKWRK